MDALTPIFEQIEASIAGCMTDLKQRIPLASDLLADLSAAGIEFKVKASCCRVAAYAVGDAIASVSILLNHAPKESILAPICKRHGSGWHISKNDRAALIYVQGIAVLLCGITLDITERQAA